MSETEIQQYLSQKINFLTAELTEKQCMYKQMEDAFHRITTNPSYPKEYITKKRTDFTNESSELKQDIEEISSVLECLHNRSGMRYKEIIDGFRVEIEERNIQRSLLFEQKKESHKKLIETNQEKNRVLKLEKEKQKQEREQKRIERQKREEKRKQRNFRNQSRPPNPRNNSNSRRRNRPHSETVNTNDVLPRVNLYERK